MNHYPNKFYLDITSFNTRVPKDEVAPVQLGALITEAKPFFYSRTPVLS